MAEDDDDRTHLFRDPVEERTTEFQPPAEIQELRKRLASALKSSSTSSRPQLPDTPTMPKVELPVEEEPTFEAPRALYEDDDATVMFEDVTDERPEPPRYAREEPTHVAPRPKPPVPPRGAAASEGPTHVGRAPSGRHDVGARAPSGRHESPQRPTPSRDLKPRPPKPERELPKRPSGADATVITDPSAEPDYNKGLVPRNKPRPSHQQISADLLAEAGDLARLGPADQTVIGYASSVTGFHDIEVLGRSVPLRRPRRLVVTMGLLLGIAMTGALTVTLLQAWTTPERIAVLAATGMLVSAVLTGLVGASVWKEAIRGSIFGAVTGLICSLGCGLVAGAWAQEDVRASILNSWQGRSQTLRDALDDDSEVVRAAACKKILERDDKQGRLLLLPSLTVSPAAASECLAGEETEMAAELAGLLAQRWNRELIADMKATDGAERIRSITAAIPSLPLDRAEIDLRLLHCTFNATKDLARDECAATLGATFETDDQWGSRLNGIAELGVHDGPSARGVIAMAVGSPSLVVAHEKLARQADASALGNQWSALTVASEAVAHGATEPVPELVAALEKSCALDVVKLPQSRDSWFSVTTDAVERRGKGERMLDALCTAATNAFKADAFANARALVGASIRQSGRKGARDIDSGWLMLNQATPQTQSDLRSMIPPGTPEDEAQKIMKIYSQGPKGESHPLILQD